MRWISVGVAVAGGVALFRQHWLHVGATPDERRQLLPGDELLLAAQSVSTQAITIPGHLDAVWPWIAQMGYGGRAGFYSYPVLEWVGGARRTRRIHGLPDPKPGDRIPYFTPQPLVVDEAAPPRVLVLAQRVPSARKVRVDWTWSFVLSELSDGGTRLVVRMRMQYTPKWAGLLVHLVMEPAHAVLGSRQLRGIAQRVGGEGAVVYPRGGKGSRRFYVTGKL
jgi:hypothetical protein